MSEGVWRVERIDKEEVVDGSGVTLDLSQAGSVSGSTGCNRYTGELDASDGRFRTGKLVTTRRACAPAIAKQEAQFLEALEASVSYGMKAGTGLILKDDRQQTRLVLTEVVSADNAQQLPQDGASRQIIAFHCEGFGIVGVRFLGADTIELSMNGNTSVLPRKVTASGAQYADDNLVFWNKGDEALLRIAKQDYQCQRKENK
ncbi:hypothetical protein GCM10007391_10140 [Alteromonas halophila]|uniref:META domain-containing protein n=1 Tax=Alteromonas halophila TaxID=516698 RepID=A0A918MX04_9ALTE|nr:hypothetical protein GCM10007391_10140 [Alteromonas halophila]